MSGSSLDGLDVAAVQFAGSAAAPTFEVLAAETVAYSSSWHERLQAAPDLSGEGLLKLHSDYGHWLGLQLRQFCVGHGVRPAFAAVHGHTVFHQPQAQFTFQLGEGQALASHLNCPVLTDFRSLDIALGGQGAPLVPLPEAHLWPSFGMFLNLGGIANLSIIPRSAAAAQGLVGSTWLKQPPAALGFDLAPCNQVLNRLARRAGQAFDENGALGRQGQLLPELLNALHARPYLHLPPPKSLGNEDVRYDWQPVFNETNRVEDQLRTYVQFLADHLAATLEKLRQTGPLLVSGGGAHNAFLVETLRHGLAQVGVEVVVPEAAVVAFKEAIAFAYLGLRRLQHRPTVLPGATGAREPSSGGAVHGSPTNGDPWV